MFGLNKRKWRWSSKSLASQKGLKRTAIREPSPDTVTRFDGAEQDDAAPLAVLSSRDDDIESSGLNSPLYSKLHESGTRLLGLMRLPNTHGEALSFSDDSDFGEAEAHYSLRLLGSEADDAYPGNTSIAFDNTQSAANSKPEAYPAERKHAGGSSDPTLGENMELEGGLAEKEDSSAQSVLEHPIPLVKSSPVPLHLEPVIVRTTSKRLRGSCSTPNFAGTFSHKFSQTFANPTVVHRPNVRSRPSLASIQDSVQAGPFSQSGPSDTIDSISPSSYTYSGSLSNGNPSTAKTSVESNTSSQRSVKTPEGRDMLPATLRNGVPARENTLTPILEAPPVVIPTITTVEAAANAKIFFETHFNSLLAGHVTPRSLRRRHLELKLESQALTEDQKHFERMVLSNLESDHLRSTRKLKSRVTANRRLQKVTIAGYQVVRILGKGSFGVVRLVREKDSSAVNMNALGPQPQDVTACKAPQKTETNGLRSTAVEALKSTFDLPRLAQRSHSNRPQKEVYAMKVIRKSDMLRNGQEAHLRAERDFLVASEHSRWVVPLIASFQDHKHLYLVMDYMVGGDFLGLLFRKNILKEKHAKWYIAEMILCVEETHRLRWIHRDIKPDNFLISSSGHLKISDFGLAFDGHWTHDQRFFKTQRSSLMELLGVKVKGDQDDQEEDARDEHRSKLASVLAEMTGEKPRPRQPHEPADCENILNWRNKTSKRHMAVSIVGTSQYMAPEVIRGDAYDGRCDWWSIGIILYECLFGFTPFVCENRDDTKAKILDNAHTMIFPNDHEMGRKQRISLEAMDLINSLLQEREHRLSSKKYRVNDWELAMRASNHKFGPYSDPANQDYKGNFVYSNDAADIKAHPFFGRVAWDRIHLSRPPFVPEVKSRDDTRYFDEEDPVSDVDDASTCSEDNVSQPASDQVKENAQLPGSARHISLDDIEADKENECDGTQLAGKAVPAPVKRQKCQKRPRDRVLRDKEARRTALDIRKNGAFLGYTYRRPRFAIFDDEQQGRHSPLHQARRGLIPSFG